MEKIGEGSYGEVRKLKIDDRFLAIKTIPGNDGIFIVTEVSLYNIMSHPNVLTPLGYSITDSGDFNIIMDYYPETLKNAIGKKLSLSTILMYFWRILSAMDYIHHNNIIHRDVKPENVLINGMNVVVADFGLSVYRGKDFGFQNTDIATYTYRAPEVQELINAKQNKDWKNFETLHSQITGKVDMWSVGCMLYECVTGDNNTINKLNKIDTCPEPVRPLITGLLQRNPNDRMSASEAMKCECFKGFWYQKPENIVFPSKPEIRFNDKQIDIIKTYIKENGCTYFENVFNYMLGLLTICMDKDKKLVTINNIVNLYTISLYIVRQLRYEFNPTCMVKGDVLKVFEALNHNVYYV